MQEPLEISFRDVEKTEDLERLIEDRVEHLEKFCDYIVSVHVAVERPNKHPDEGSGFRVRLVARIPPGHECVADEHASHGSVQDELPMIIRRAFQALERQVKEIVERQREANREQPGEEPIGVVTVIDKTKRFGIVKTPAGRDVFFNDRAVLQNDFDRIEVGTTVRYVDQPDENGPRASTIAIVDKSGRPPQQNPPIDPEGPLA